MNESTSKPMSKPASNYPVPRLVYVDSEAAADPLTKRILARLPGVQVSYSEQSGDPLRARMLSGTDSGVDRQSDSKRFSQGKQILKLGRYQGNWLKSCPGTSEHVCCNLWIVNPGEGCPMDCTYCYLQDYLIRNPTLKLYTNTDSMLNAIRSRAEAEPSRLFRVGTGEVIDSLVWDELTDLSLELVPVFARVPNLSLELKTKSDSISNLLELRSEHKGKTVISWSVNAKQVSESDELYTASLERRVEAACKVIDAGYRVGFHFDPIIHFAGWKDGYRDAIKSIFSRVDPRRVAWISISTLRYRPTLQKVMEQRFPASRIPFGEQFLAKDGKLRYVQPLRFQMVKFVWNELKSVYPGFPLYMCMESSAAWKHISGGAPAKDSELIELFSRRKITDKTERPDYTAADQRSEGANEAVGII